MSEERYVDIKSRVAKMDAHIMEVEGPNLVGDGEPIKLHSVRLATSEGPLWYAYRTSDNTLRLLGQEISQEMEKTFQNHQAKAAS